MFNATTHMIGLAIAAVVIFGTGLFMTRSGRPFNAVLFSIHKLLSLAVVIFIGILVYKAAPLTFTDWTFVASAAVLCIVSFISGGVISAMDKAPSWAIWSHRIGVWLTGIAILLCLIKIIL